MAGGTAGRDQVPTGQDQRKGKRFAFPNQGNQMDMIRLMINQPGPKDRGGIRIQTFKCKGRFLGGSAAILAQHKTGQQASFFTIGFSRSIELAGDQRKKRRNSEQRFLRIQVRQQRQRRKRTD